MPGVVVIDLARLAEVLAPAQHGDDLVALRAIVTAETTAFAGWSQAAGVTPTVVALRSRAADVVDAELTRLTGRLPDLDASSREEVAQTVRRVVDKLLHAPTVRMKELSMLRWRHVRRCFASVRPRLTGVSRCVFPVQRDDGADRPIRLGTRRARSPSRSRAASRRHPTTQAVGSSWSRSPVRRSLVEALATIAAPACSSAPCATRSSTATSTSPSTRTRTCRPGADGLVVAAVPVREDARDVWSREQLDAGRLAPGSRIGTGSPRRMAQLRALGYGLDVEPIRGNVDTRSARLPKVSRRVVLAYAGLSGWGGLAR